MNPIRDGSVQEKAPSFHRIRQKDAVERGASISGDDIPTDSIWDTSQSSRKASSLGFLYLYWQPMPVKVLFAEPDYRLTFLEVLRTFFLLLAVCSAFIG